MKRLVLLVAGVIVLSGCARDAAPPGSSKTPVIVISVDTLRSDHLPAYGYTGVETPHLDALRADSILYERAYSHCPLTLPSHATVFTGLLPADTGVRDNIGYQLAEKVPTLAETLRARGYATGGAVSAFVLRKQTGISRGFTFYDDETELIGPSRVIGRIQRRAPETVKIANQWIAGQKEKPFFFFLHLYDPHTPYDPPEPYAKRYPVPYDAEIAYTDAALGSFITSLKEAGVYDRALIVFLSDHGEGLNDHQEEEHGMFLYREAIQVPLLVKLPSQALKGTSVAAPVQLVDVFPTILDQTATEFDRSKVAGRSLLDFLDSKTAATVRPIYSESYFARFHFGWSDVHSLIEGDNHFIRAPKPELYDLAADPGEKSNQYPANRRVYTAMRQAIEPLVKKAAAPAAVDPEEAAKLAALGYLGSGAAADVEGELPDPKDKIDTLRQIRVAFTLQRDRRYEEALNVVDELLADNARMMDLWDLKSKILERLGRFPEAIEAGKQALRLSPNSTHLAIAIANLYIELKDPAQAEAHAHLALKSEPGRAHEVLARVWLLRGDLAKAEEEARISLADKTDRVTSLMTLARIEKERGRFEAAIRYLDDALGAVKGKRAVTKLHFMRGDVLARLGRDAEAEKEFKEEIEWFPEDPQPYKNLIVLYALQGRNREATQLVFDLIKESPTPPAYLAVAETLRVIGDDRGSRYWARRGLQQFPRAEMLRKFAS
jgi:arylsulfatase A-like enzyme/predicted negative regulator of RcsB-dependent stress response